MSPRLIAMGISAQVLVSSGIDYISEGQSSLAAVSKFPCRFQRATVSTSPKATSLLYQRSERRGT